MWSSSTISMMTCAKSSRSVPCLSCVYFPIVVKPWLLLAYQQMGLTCADWLWSMATPTGYELLCGGWPHKMGVAPAGSLYLMRPLFGCATHGTNQMVLCCGLTPASRYVGSTAPWEGLPCRPKSAVAYDCPGLPGRSYKAIQGWPLPVLNLEASGGETILRNEALCHQYRA